MNNEDRNRGAGGMGLIMLALAYLAMASFLGFAGDALITRFTLMLRGMIIAGVIGLGLWLIVGKE